MDHALKVEVSGDVATLTLNRSRKKNALTLAMWSTLPGLLAEVAADRAAKVLVVRGAGGTAMIEGACVGGGLGLALACDLRIAAADAWLALTPAKLGLVYSLPDTRRLVQAVGLSRAKDILFTGRLIAAEEALVIGLVDALYAPEALEAAVAEKTAQIAAASQWTARRAKAIVGLIADGETRDTDETARWLIEAVEGEDFSEGRNAFLSKRKPEFPFR